MSSIKGLLAARPSVVLAQFIEDCEFLRLDAGKIRAEIDVALNHYRGKTQCYKLEDRWYASLRGGSPDYSIYADDAYVADMWACWEIYSRKYLRQLFSFLPLSVLSDPYVRVADLGCGVGLTCAAMKDARPGWFVYGTNIIKTTQWRMATLNALRYEFNLVESAEEIGRADLLFASEYFEHIQQPIDHLDVVLKQLQPTAVIVANAFGAKSMGHFDEYLISGALVSGVEASRAFSARLRELGYEKQKTKLWNQRPACWLRASR